MKLNALKQSSNPSISIPSSNYQEKMIPPRVTWEELRKEARGLENQIDMKLVSLSKFGTALGQAHSVRKVGTGDREPLLAGEGGDDERTRLNDMSNELELLLSNLSAINDSMSHLGSEQNGQSASIHHTLQRHREILLDYKQEFTRTKANLLTTFERRDLLNSTRRDSPLTNSNRSRMDMLMKENEHARNSERLLDEQINIAMESRETLINQRQAFKVIQAKLNDLSSRFPMVNNLVQKINLRKRRDTIILGTVIGLCLTFLIWYALA